MDKEQAKIEIQKLINKYDNALKSGQLKKYSEEDTKKDFILPMFETLGWNVHSRKEVSSEEHIISAGRVDYGFYLNGKPKFYLEAKALKEDLNKETFAEQSIKYSWNKSVTWAVLTDFESLKVFNAEVISRYLSDKMFFEISCNEYIERFDQLWLLSKDSFEKNLLSKEAEKVGKKMQKISVDSTLYKDLKDCRDILTENLGACNNNIDNDSLDEGVQKLLDRLIFIRVAEDRGIEEPILKPIMRQFSTKGIEFASMIKKFRELDEIYNSNLFTKHPFEKWEDYSGATAEVIEKLYGKKGYYEYDFKAMSSDVLGGVYENYLGYRLFKSKKGITLDKDAKKKKEQGIYYTPIFIVDYIVENALKPVLDKCESINDLKKIKVLDPACGSGSFLVKALNLINKKYKEFGNKGDEYTKLTILMENIYGVDLDEQAVEIARLNLLISALDERRKLPNLNQNIKVGNSLISGTDEELRKQFGKNFRDKKPFNWQEEFPDVFKQGGFDVIIGNPPYISAIQDSKGDLVVREFYRQKYSLKGAFDIYAAFLLRGIELSNKHGSYGWIVPNKLMVAEYARNVKGLLLQNGLNKVIDVSKLNVFGDVGVYPIILIGDKTKNDFNEYEAKSVSDLYNEKFNSSRYVSQYKTFKDLEIKIGSGATGFQAKLLTKSMSEEQHKETIPFIVSGSIDPYQVNLSDVRYMGKNYKYAFIKRGEGIAESKWSFWNKDKIVISGMTKRIEAHYYKKPLALGVGVYAIFDYGELNPYFLLAILNSKFLTYSILEKFKHKHLAGGYLAINKSTLEQLPIVKPNAQIEKLLANLAVYRISLTDEFSKSIENSNEWENIKTKIERTDKKIDEEVYKLYDLTNEEIKIIEAK